ncbi:amino acid adenylation domain-containing protein [Dokdonia ponticola]|uniref:Amino acid adenylation domain-containing protein n=1 Tax=Dokdonia ponticola TaxID=2041041 RepID=A0ABV9HZK5_9FLAO
MKTAKDILKTLRQQQIKLVLNGDDIEVISYDNKLSKEQILLIKSNKEGIIQYLKTIDNKKVVSEIPNVPLAKNYPLSNSQRRLWVVSQMEESSIAYNLPVSIVLDGTYDIPCFTRSIEATIDRHEILRTVFREDSNGEVSQWVLDRESLGFSIDYKDFSTTSSPSEISKNYVAEDSYKVFDLANGPLIRASIHKLSEDQYVFYYNMHHIISDGWSMNVLAKDVMAYYDAYITQAEPNLTDLRIQYKDYASWELEQLEGELFDTHKSYWLDKLSGELPVIDLPGQKSRPKFKGNRGETIKTFVSPKLTKGLNDFVKGQKGSLFTGILTILNALFYRYTAKGDIIIGSPMVGRDNLDLQDQIGFYVNSLAFRNEVNAEDSLVSLYQHVKTTVLNGFDHKLYPFDRLVEDLDVPYDMSRTPIFDISLTLHDPIDGEGVQLPSLEDMDNVSPVTVGVSKNDVEFHFRQIGEVLSFGINYNSDVYDAETLANVMSHFKQLLSNMLMNPEKAISTIDYLRTEEKQELLSDFNTNTLEYPENTTLLSLFQEQVQNTPDTVALVYEEKELTYSELDTLSSQLANCLRVEYNVQEGDLIGIHLDRSELFILSILGILKSGGAYVPIDPEYPESRKEYIINDANIKLLLTSTNYMFDMDYYEETLFAIDVEFDASEYNPNLDYQVSPSALAYVIYTSGSTGNPKGVLIPHKSITNTILAQIEAFHMRACERSLQFASFSFDASVSEIFITLLSGTTLYVVSDDKKNDPKQLESYIVDNKIDVATLPPSYLKLINIESLKNMKVLVTAGEAAVYDKVMSFIDQGGIFINAYGPTEVSICGSTYEMTKETQLASTTIPIGGPIANAQLYVLDPCNNLQPKGVVGEICIGGKGLAIGYLNREDLTAEKFIPNPFVEGERLYKTGDFGKWLPEGIIEFVGREDDQVKIRGHRIELGEIEYQLESKDDIREAVVLAKESPSGDKELIAYVVTEKEQKVSELRAFLLRTLPEYMLPSLYVEIDEIPLTVNGKINKKQLFALSGDMVSDQVAFEAPTNETEEKIVAIWKKILHLDSISIHDEFFLLGGQSLKAISLINEYQKVFNVEIKLKNIFENPTVANQASYIQKAAKIQFVQIQKIEEQDSYPISNAQKRLWILSQVEKGSIAYNIPFSTILQGEYNITRFAKAIDTVIERHEILRTVFREEDSGEVRQHILSKDALGFAIDYQDFKSEENPEAMAKAYIASDANTAFDLANGPLLRASLLQLSDEQYVFYYNTHHIISDGWSMDVLSRDVHICYKAYMEGLAPELPELRIQYKEYATWQLSQIETKEYQDHKTFWTESLKGDLPILELPKKGARPSVNTYEGKGLRTYISQETTSGLKNLSQDQGGSLFMGLLAAWNVLFNKYTTSKDIIIGSPVAGRGHADLENQIGFYVNTVALRNQINTEQSFTTFYNEVKQTTMSAFSHQSYPFDCVVEDLDIKREKGANAIFDIMLALQNVGEKITNIVVTEEDENTILDLGNTVSKFDITLNFQEIGKHLIFDVIYNTSLYEEEMIKNLIHHFKQLTSNLVQSPNEKIGDVDCLLPSEKQKLLYDFNATEVAYPRDETLVTLFKEQVSKTPDKVAVVFEDEKLTYSELDNLSDKLAQCLVLDHHVKNEDFVGIKLERSNWILVSILGILKSGGVYVPIDPNYPQVRIDDIEEDCKCKVTINESFINTFEERKSQFSSEVPAITTQANSLAYVMYTSGSTGKPKGVMVEHRNVVRLVKSSAYFQLSPSNVLVSTGAVSFDATTFEYWGTLLNGAQLVMCSQNTLLDIDSLSNEIKNRDADVMWFTTGWLNQLVDTNINVFNGLTTILLGGDKLSPVHVKKLRTYYPDLKLINCYGPTENTTFSITHAIDEVSGDIPIGSPISNSTVYILNPEGDLTPMGVVGEIYLGGDGVARGYLNQPELTQEKFVRDRFRESGNIYKTGDLGRWRPDGTIDFMGRVDDQVKIRGFRIELGEIEQAIVSNSDVESVVVTTTQHSQEKSIVAYIVPSSTLDKKVLQDALKVQLPAYMVPSYYVVMDTFPLNANGKVDKSKLPDVGEDDILREEYIAPKTEEEKVLVAILEKVLKGQNISIRDNFYSLGGDSINSIQVVSRLKQEGYRLRVEHILQTPVLEELAKYMKENVVQKDQSVVSGNVGLTPIQHYFFKDSEVANTNHFNQGVALKSAMPIDEEKLKDSIQALVVHHDALRMRYKKSSDGWVQTNEGISGTHFEISFYDLTSEEDELKVMAEVSDVLQSSIDISQGPLFKVGHFRLSDGDRLALIIHHLVIDGVSWRILLEDLMTLYKGAISNQKVQLPLKTDSFQNWSSTQYQYANEAAQLEELAYWKNIGLETLPSFPVDKESDTKHLKLDKDVVFALDQETTSQLRTVAHKAYNTEMNDVLLTGLGLAIQEVFGIEKSMLCLEGHGREELNENVDLSRTVGWFTTMYPFLLEVSKDQNKEENLIKVKESLRKVPNKGIGYGIFKYLSSEELSKITTTILFNYLGIFGEELDTEEGEEEIFEYSGEYIGEEMDANEPSTTPIQVSGIIVSGALRIAIKYASSQYEEETINTLLQSYENNLKELVKNLKAAKESTLTPSDLTYKGLSIDQLSEINTVAPIEDVYKLSPLQQGIYYHWVSSKASTLYFEQLSYKLGGQRLTIDYVQSAFRQLVQRYPVLRTRFTSDYGVEPLQIVYEDVKEDFAYHVIEEETGLEEVQAIKDRDRIQGFDPNGKSQVRLIVLDLGNDSYEFVWSFHHILMDGWCISILLNDFDQILRSLHNNETLTLPKPLLYSNYIKWLDKVDIKTSLSYWKEYLSSYNKAVEIPFLNTSQGDIIATNHVDKILTIGGEAHKDFIDLCNKQSITQNTCIQGIWGCLLGHYNNTNDVIFGSVVSGRPGELSGVEQMVGLFINTIPVRVQYQQTETPLDVLKNLHATSITSKPHHYLNLSDVQAQSPLGMDLMNHIVVFENYPIQEAIQSDLQSNASSDWNLSLEGQEVFEQTNYDFNLLIVPGAKSINIVFRYDECKLDTTFMNILLEHFKAMFHQFVYHTNNPLNTCIPIAYQEIVDDQNNKIYKEILLQEILDYHNTYIQDTANMSPLKIVYRDQFLVADHQIQFWKSIFKNEIIPVQFPFQKKKTKNHTYVSNSVKVELGEKFKNGFEKISAYQKGSMETTCLFLVNMMIHKYLNTNNIMVGSSFAVEDAIQEKQYVHQLPVVTNINEESTLDDLYEAFRNHYNDVKDNATYPLSVLMNQLGLNTNTNYSGLFNILVDYYKEDGMLSKTSSTINPYDMSLEFVDDGSTIDCIVTYNTSLFDEIQITLFINRLEVISEQLVDYSDTLELKFLNDLSFDANEEVQKTLQDKLAFSLEENF